MKLNGLDLISYVDRSNRVQFVLSGSVLDEAVALDGQTLTVTDGEDDEQMAVFAGYNVMSVSLEDMNTVVLCIREIEEAAKDAIVGLDANVKILTQRVDRAEQKVNSAEQNVAQLTNTVGDVAESVSQDIVTFAKMVVPTMTADMTNTEVCSVVSLLPEWKVGASYELHDAFTYEGKVYRAAQKIPEAQEHYKPGAGTESLYTLIELAPDGIRVWKTVTDATNSFALGEKCHYPDAEGKIYVSKRDGNTSVPGTDAWWELEAGQEE